MSYCRFSEGDVYLYRSHYHGIVCYACELCPMEDDSLADKNDMSVEEAIEHLKEHVILGHVVPEESFILLRKELEVIKEDKKKKDFDKKNPKRKSNKK